MRLSIFLFLMMPLSAVCAETAKPPSLLTVHVSSGSKTVQVFGRVIPDEGAVHVQLSEVKGRISFVILQPGDKVKAGAPLAKYSGPSCHSKDTLCTIPAKFDGVIDELLKSNGTEVNVGDGLVSILDPSSLSIRIDVPAKYLKYIWLGQTIRLRSPQKHDAWSDARVVEILPALGFGETTRGARLKLLSPLAGLRQDSVINAEISVPLSSSGIKVPAKAIAFLNGRHFVIKKSDETLQAIPVQIISETSDSLWINPLPEAPLKNGDSLLAEGVIYYLPRAMNIKVD